MAQINFRIDDSVKNQAEELFSAFGMNVTTACMIFIRQSLAERAIPFQIRQVDNRRPAAELDERLRDMEEGCNSHMHELITIPETRNRRRTRAKAMA